MRLLTGKGRTLLIALVVLASALLFFALAFSRLETFWKVAVLLVELSVTGIVLKGLTGVEGYYGLLIVRGLAGFKQMRWIAKRYANQARSFADLGLSIAFGLPYSWKVFWRERGERKKFAWHVAAVVLFYAFFFLAQATGGLSLTGDALLFLGLGLAAGLFGVGMGFVGLHAWNVLTVPNTPPGIMLLVPGVTVPWEALVAIIIIAVVHEVAHGVLFTVEKIRLKSSGVLLFGFLPLGAFVEPEEARFAKVSVQKKRRVLVAGSTSNLLFFFVFLFLAALAAPALDSTIAAVKVSAITTNSTAPIGLVVGEAVPASSARELQASLTRVAMQGEGSTELGGKQVRFVDVVVREVEPGFPAAGLLEEGEVIQGIDGAAVHGLNDLKKALAERKQGDGVVLETSQGFKPVFLGEGGRIGVSLAETMAVEFEDQAFPGFEWLYAFLSFLLVVLVYTYLLNFILAMVNLLPLFITDGHRIVFEELRGVFGQKTAASLTLALGVFTLALLALNALPWFL